MDDDRAFNEGLAAREGGKPSSANPYEPETLAYYHWEKGWEDTDLAEGDVKNV